uniref:AS2 protein n=1 Tax=Ceratopteris pteridoides TaxID=58167 RepID=A0A411F6W0_9MONI|nr:AS2 protein [Ceratopteris pteridoides]
MATSSISLMNSSSSPCAACKFLRRKCTAECVFAPYFPPDQPHKFANVHKVFGASNITKLLNELPPHKREDAVNSLAYEADARVKDPVYGCVGAISILQRQVLQLQQELAIAQSDLARLVGVSGSAIQQQQLAMLQGPGPSHGIGMGMLPAGQSTYMQQHGAHQDHHTQQYTMAQHPGRLMGARDVVIEQLLDQLQRSTQLTREQLIEQLTRAGGGSFESGLAALAGGMSLSPNTHNITEDGSGNSRGGSTNNVGHLSPS